MALISGARSEYDILLPVALELQSAGLDPLWVLGASHLSIFHGGRTYDDTRDGIPVVAQIESLLPEDSWPARATSFANLLSGLIPALTSLKPDLVIVAGDREEALAGALAASFLQIPIAHIFGGDRCRATELDEVLRPAISKLAHLHFSASEEHRQRLIAMGEREEFVWTTGGPNIDVLRMTPDTSDDELSMQLGFNTEEDFILFIYHPSPMLEPIDGYTEMCGILREILGVGIPVVASYPNSDPGNHEYRRALQDMQSQFCNLYLHHNLPRQTFVSLYRRSTAIVGNSSSIVTESSFMGVPGLLIGPRQDLRKTSTNVLRVNAEPRDVGRGIQRLISDKEFRDNARKAISLYGDGYASSRIVDIIRRVSITPELFQKAMTY